MTEVLQNFNSYLLEMERQLPIISAMIERMRSRWGLPRGLPVIRQRRHRFRPWLTWAELDEEGRYTTLMPGLEQKITAELQRDGTLMRDPVSPGVKLAVTLRHLATGDSYTTLQYAFRVASLTINKFVPETCDTITRSGDAVPQTPIGLVAGRVHLPPKVELPACSGCPGWKPYFRCPQGGVSLYHNYSFHSIVLLAWWMEIKSSGGWMWGQPGQAHMLRFLSSPI